jgi:hypothetical protein
MDPKPHQAALRRAKRAKLGEMKPGDAAAIVGKVVATHLDQARITAAKFSSFI